MKTVTYDETKWKLVPLEPDENMIKAGLDSVMNDRPLGFAQYRTTLAYKAMLSAAPTPEEPAAQRYDHSDDALYLGGKDE